MIRKSGILCHPTSLHNQYGMGDIGSAAMEFIDYLDLAGISYWQVLPLNPTGYGDSPYQCFSAFAGNPYLIAPDWLVDQGIIGKSDLPEVGNVVVGTVDFGSAIPWKQNLLKSAYQSVASESGTHAEFVRFCDEQRYWLDDFATFMSLKDLHKGVSWVEWEMNYVTPSKQTIMDFRRENKSGIDLHKWAQYFFFMQWRQLRTYAAGKGIRIVGDVPIYVAHDSADVWANQELFQLDSTGRPTVVAGVPPDYFSETGQLWGNPLYRWEVEKSTDFAWWRGRMRHILKTVDSVRLDHFRGFAGYWEVPASELTAVRGRWVAGPGHELFDALASELGSLPLIAEDLGEITQDVVELRDRYDLPGMKIFQFGFSGDPEHEFLPHNYPENCVAYTGTHDNETLVGWFGNASADVRAQAQDYTISDGVEIHWDMMRSLWDSKAFLVVAQMQDILGVGDAGRMNFPGRPAGNWRWRLPPDGLHEIDADRMRKMNLESKRADINVAREQPGNSATS